MNVGCIYNTARSICLLLLFQVFLKLFFIAGIFSGFLENVFSGQDELAEIDSSLEYLGFGYESGYVPPVFVASETESFIKSEPEPFSYFEPETVYEEPMNDIYESLLTGTFDDEGDGDGDVDGDGDGEPDVDAVVRPAPKTRKRRHLDEDDDPDFVREGNAKNDEKLVLNAAVRVVKLLAICHYYL